MIMLLTCDVERVTAQCGVGLQWLDYMNDLNMHSTYIVNMFAKFSLSFVKQKTILLSW